MQFYKAGAKRCDAVPRGWSKWRGTITRVEQKPQPVRFELTTLSGLSLNVLSVLPGLCWILLSVEPSTLSGHVKSSAITHQLDTGEHSGRGACKHYKLA
eukprot:234156-Pelagomonas_calceolata.AAC.2